MTVKDIPIESPIEEKIDWAKKCFREKGTDLLRDEEIGILLNWLKDAIHASRREMAQTGIIEFCRLCEQEEGGSCCGIGLEKKYTGVLLLINLLLGHPIPDRRENPSSCFFLGNEGCGLLSRQVICINYLCKKITDQIELHKIAPLRDMEGIELDLLFHLIERIKKVLATSIGRA